MPRARGSCDASSIWHAAPARRGRDTLRRWRPLAPGSMQMALRPSPLAVPANRLEVLDPATGNGAMSLHASYWMNLHAQQARKLIKLTNRCKSYNQIIIWPAERGCCGISNLGAVTGIEREHCAAWSSSTAATLSGPHGRSNVTAMGGPARDRALWPPCASTPAAGSGHCR